MFKPGTLLGIDMRVIHYMASLEFPNKINRYALDKDRVISLENENLGQIVGNNTNLYYYLITDIFCEE